MNGLLTATFDPTAIFSDANGCIPEIWVQGNPYRVRISTPGGVQIRDIDNLPGDVVTQVVGGGGGTSDLTTGDVIWSYRTGTRTNFVRLNGRTIGSAVSGASEFANASAHDLFVFLWNGNPALAVSGGRGASAEADWAANKTIALPDARFRALVGLDDMGNTAAGRAIGATFGTGGGTTLGSVGGTAGETLLSSQIPAHSHAGTVDGAGSHQHAGVTGANGFHSHSASADVQGDHAHLSVTLAGFSSFGAGGAGGAWIGTGQQATSVAGAHAHNITINGEGSHVHYFTSDAAGFHAHTFTSNLTGGGAAHNNMQPFILGTWFMRL
jgi:microcystin-dependent protein